MRSTVLHLTIVLFFAAWPAVAEAVTELSFVPSAGEVNCDEIIDVDIVIDGGTADLRGFSIVIDIDQSLLQLVDVLPGQLFVDAPCDPFLYFTSVGTGAILIDEAGLGCSVAGPGPIARVRLLGLADGISPLQGLSATLRNSSNLPIAANWTDGTLLVNCPVSNAPSSWSTVKSDYR